MDPSNPKCANYDPCFGVEPPSAEFTIQESYMRTFPQPTQWLWTPDDSIFFGGNILFSSPYKGSEYKHTWYLGAEIIHEAEFTRDHSIPHAQRPYHITVSHVLEYPIDSACYPSATGRDSIARTYRLVRFSNEFATIGKFRGAFKNEVDSFDFSFLHVMPDGSPAEIFAGHQSNFISENFHNEGDTISIRTFWANRVLSLTGSTWQPKGLMEVDPATGKFELKYQYYYEDYEVSGRKIE